MVANLFIGTDLVEVSRIQSAIKESSERFLNRIYTPGEQKYCQSKASPEIHYAGRFAAKEAVMKALKSSGLYDPIAFSAIEIQQYISKIYFKGLGYPKKWEVDKGTLVDRKAFYWNKFVYYRVKDRAFPLLLSSKRTNYWSRNIDEEIYFDTCTRHD